MVGKPPIRSQHTAQRLIVNGGIHPQRRAARHVDLDDARSLLPIAARNSRPRSPRYRAGRRGNRRAGIYRAVPVPPAVIETLDMAHGIRELQGKRGKGRDMRLWPWSRMTAWRQVHAVWTAPGSPGRMPRPRGWGTASGWRPSPPASPVQKWLGHAQFPATAIYADAVGAEEKDIAQRMWR